MTTPTAGEWLISLEQHPEQYADLLAIHDGHLASAAWVLAHAQLSARCHPGPPCPGELHAAALEIAARTGVTVPSGATLARDAAAVGYQVSGL